MVRDFRVSRLRHVPEQNLAPRRSPAKEAPQPRQVPGVLASLPSRHFREHHTPDPFAKV